MGIFDNEETFLKDQRRDIVARTPGIKGNTFRSLGRALKLWESQFGEDAQLARNKDIMLRQIDMDSELELNFAIKQLQEVYGDREGAIQLIQIRDRVALRNKKSERPMREDINDRLRYTDGKKELVFGNLEVDKASDEDGTLVQEVRDEKGLIREGLFNKRTGALIRYLGAGYKPSTDTKAGAWDQVTIKGPDGKNIGAIWNKSQDKGMWQIPGVGTITTEAAMNLGYDLTAQGTAGTSKWDDKTLYLTDESGRKLPVAASHDKLTDVWRWRGLDGKERVALTSNLPGGVTTVPPKDPKVPSTRNVRDDRDIVNQEWDPVKRQWFEVGRGSITDYGIGNQNWKSVFTAYEKALVNREINEQIGGLERIKVTARNEGGLESKALQAALARMFGSRSRAIAELDRFASFGDITERVAIAVSKFFTGEYTETGRKGALRLAYLYERDIIRPALEDINQRFEKIAREQGVDPDTVLQRMTPSKQIERFTVEEIIARGNEPGYVEGLDLFERQIWDDRLDELLRNTPR